MFIVKGAAIAIPQFSGAGAAKQKTLLKTANWHLDTHLKKKLKYKNISKNCCSDELTIFLVLML